MRPQGQVPRDLARKMIDGMRDRRLETGVEFVAGGQPSGLVPGFEHQHFLTLLRKVASAHQPIVPRANDDRVVAIQFGSALCSLAMLAGRLFTARS